MLSMTVPSGLLGQGRHAPIGTVDSTATGPLGQAPIGSHSPDRWVPSVPCGSWPTDQVQGSWPVRRRVRPATAGHDLDHRSEDFLYELKAGPPGGRLRRPSSADNVTITGNRLTLPPGPIWPPPLGQWADRSRPRLRSRSENAVLLGPVDAVERQGERVRSQSGPE